MKSVLLLSAVMTAATFSARAEQVVDLDQTYTDMKEYPYYVMDGQTAPEIVNGNLVVKNETKGNPWDKQYFVCYDFKSSPDVTYTMTARIKSSGAGNLQFSFGNWGDQLYRQTEIAGDNEWHDVTVEFNEVKTDECFIIFQSGEIVGTMEIASVKVTHEGEGGDTPDIPTDKDVVASFFTGNGKTFGGWGGNAVIENAEEDGKPCLKVTNTEAEENNWAIQLGIDADFTPGKTYYISFDVKGTPAKGITSGFQCTDGYAGCGDMTTFEITEDWNSVVIYGEAKDADGKLPDRWICNIGNYVGTFYMTNVVVYTEKTTGIEKPISFENGRTVVYNLMGVKVLDSENASDMNALPSGLYIVNGKKILIRK